jgi:hypothetical protein
MADVSETWDPDRIAYTLDLTPAELKVTHTALRSMLDDFGHDERDVIRVVQQVLGKLPDEASIRAIDLRNELRGR